MPKTENACTEEKPNIQENPFNAPAQPGGIGTVDQNPKDPLANPPAAFEFLPPAKKTSDAPAGLEAMDKSDIVIPRMTIVQPGSEDGTPGTFRLNLTGDEYETLEVVFLNVLKRRVMYPSSFSRANLPLCGSKDRKAPDPRYENPMAERCAECDYGKWIERLVNGIKTNRPQCDEVLELLGMPVELQIPFFLGLRGVSIKPGKSLISMAYLLGKAHKLDLCDFQTTMHLKEIKSDRGRYFAVQFDRLTILKNHPYRDLAQAYAYEEPTDIEPQAADGIPF